MRRLARSILARPEFAEPPASLLVRARDWVFAQVRQFAERLFEGGAPSATGWLAVALAALALVALALRIRRGFVPDPAAPVASGEVGPLRPAAWRAEAARRAALGAWREALRCRYRAVVAELAERGLLDDVPGRTTGEQRALLAAAFPAAAAAFAALTDLFESGWYGPGDVGPGDLARAAELERAVLAKARR